MSALGSTASRSWLTATGHPSREGGSRVGGATRVTSAPSMEKASTLDRATRECLTSPTMAMRSPPERAPLLLDREAVEQGLGGVLVPAVAGVDHRAVDPRGHLPGHARRRVADDDGVDPHGLDGLHRVPERLALLHRRRRHREVHGVGRQPLGRGLERQPGAGGLLEEEGDHRLAPQGGHLGHGPLADLDEGVADPQHLLDPVRPQVGDRQQVPGGGRVTASPPRRRRRRARRPPRRGGWGGSCPRSRGGWAAPGGPGRPSPPAAPPGAGRSR